VTAPSTAPAAAPVTVPWRTSITASFAFSKIPLAEEREDDLPPELLPELLDPDELFALDDLPLPDFADEPDLPDADLLAPEDFAPDELPADEDLPPDDLDDEAPPPDDLAEPDLLPLDEDLAPDDLAEDDLPAEPELLLLPVDLLAEPDLLPDDLLPADLLVEPEPDLLPADLLAEPEPDLLPADLLAEPEADLLPADLLTEPEPDLLPADLLADEVLFPEAVLVVRDLDGLLADLLEDELLPDDFAAEAFDPVVPVFVELAPVFDPDDADLLLFEPVDDDVEPPDLPELPLPEFDFDFVVAMYSPFYLKGLYGPTLPLNDNRHNTSTLSSVIQNLFSIKMVSDAKPFVLQVRYNQRKIRVGSYLLI
jgi:hypothetical protein